jgi:hypothetical protein
MWTPVRGIVENKIREFLKKVPKETEIQIESQEVYAWLVSEGISVGEGDMEAVFNSFRREGLIRGVGLTGSSDERKRHGNFRITWIGKWL